MENLIDDSKEDVQEQISATENGNSFTSQVEDKEVAFASENNSNVGAVLENNGSDTSLSGQNGELSPEGSLNKGYASIFLTFSACLIQFWPMN